MIVLNSSLFLHKMYKMGKGTDSISIDHFGSIDQSGYNWLKLLVKPEVVLPPSSDKNIFHWLSDLNNM